MKSKFPAKINLKVVFIGFYSECVLIFELIKSKSQKASHYFGSFVLQKNSDRNKFFIAFDCHANEAFEFRNNFITSF